MDVEGYEGPLDVLLALARRQKVDLARISMVDLADQYLAFVARARHRHLELAADYLVMAAWLAYLKSRLLIPREEEEAPSPELMAEALQFQLRRLESMRDRARALMALPLLERDVFRCGSPGRPARRDPDVWRESLWRLLRAYGELLQRVRRQDWRPEPVEVFSVEAALQRLEALVGELPEWKDMINLLPEDLHDGLYYRSLVSSTLVAGLELARQGKAELRQDGAWDPDRDQKARRMKTPTRDVRIVEALLFASPQPVDEKDIAERLGDDADVAACLGRLAEDYRGRGRRTGAHCRQVVLSHGGGSRLRT